MRLPFGVMVRDVSGLEPRTFKPTGVCLNGEYLEWYDFPNHTSRHSQFDNCVMVLRPVAYLVTPRRTADGIIVPFVEYAMQRHTMLYGTRCRVQRLKACDDMVMAVTVGEDGVYKPHFLDDFIELRHGIYGLRFLCANQVDFLDSVNQGLAVFEDGMETMQDIGKAVVKARKSVTVDMGESYEEC